jgi:hypothetical protein
MFIIEEFELVLKNSGATLKGCALGREIDAGEDISIQPSLCDNQSENLHFSIEYFKTTTSSYYCSLSLSSPG